MSFLLELSQMQPQSLEITARDHAPWMSEPAAAQIEFANLVEIIRRSGRVWRDGRAADEQRQKCAKYIRFTSDLVKVRLAAWCPADNWSN